MKKRWLLCVSLVIFVISLLLVSLVLAKKPSLTKVTFFADNNLTQQRIYFKENAMVYVRATDTTSCCKDRTGMVVVNGIPELSFSVSDSGNESDLVANDTLFQGSFKLGREETDEETSYLHLDDAQTALVYVVLKTSSTGLAYITADYTLPSTVALDKINVKKNEDVMLQWTSATDTNSIDYYYVYRSLAPFSEDNKTSEEVILFTSNKASFTDTTAKATKTYYYGISAVDVAGNVGLLSNVESVYVPDTTPPKKITSLFAVAQSNGKIQLSWDPAVDNVGVSYYNLYKSTEPIKTIKDITPLNLMTNFYKDTATDDGTAYYYVVTAVDFDANEAEASNLANATADATPPVQLSINATAGKLGSIHVTWDAAEPDTTYYLYKDESPFTSIGNITPLELRKTSYVDYPTTTTYYAVIAEDVAGNQGDLSPIVNATPDATLPLPITDLTATDQGNLTVKLEWTATPSSDVASYAVYRSETEDYTLLGNIPSSTITSFIDATVQHNTTYSYRVHVVDIVGNEENNTLTATVTVLDTSLTLEVYYPLTNTSFEQQAVILIGKTDIDVTLVVNATGGIYNTTYIDADGGFLAYVALVNGSNTITLQATDSAGNMKQETLIVETALPPADNDSGGSNGGFNSGSDTSSSVTSITEPSKGAVKQLGPVRATQRAEQQAKEALAHLQQQQQAIFASPRQLSSETVNTLTSVDPSINNPQKSLVAITAKAIREPSPGSKQWRSLGVGALALVTMGVLVYLYYLKPKKPDFSKEEMDKILNEGFT